MTQSKIIFDDIWSQYRTNLKAFLHSRISDSDEVEDLLQIIFIKIYQKHHTVKSQDSLQSWLFQVANNTLIDYYRKNRNTSKLNENDLWQDTLNPQAEMDLSACIEPFIAALPANSAELLTQIDIKGQSQKAYAESKGLSYSTLKSRVQNARKQLHELFLNCCHFTLDQHGSIIDYEPKTGDCEKC